MKERKKIEIEKKNCKTCKVQKDNNNNNILTIEAKKKETLMQMSQVCFLFCGGENYSERKKGRTSRNKVNIFIKQSGFI